MEDVEGVEGGKDGKDVTGVRPRLLALVIRTLEASATMAALVDSGSKVSKVLGWDER